jgi:hypothetical protein
VGRHRRSLIAVGLLAALLVAAPGSLARNDNPRVLPPHANAFGKSYGEWGGGVVEVGAGATRVG